MKRHIITGVIAGVFLTGLYLGIITLLQDWSHAIDQFARMWYWLAVLAGGLGIQAGLYSFIRREMRARHTSATASVAASGGVSAGSMIACCAHHLTDVLPFLGLTGLATVLVEYQPAFIGTGILSNIVGITLMLDTIQRHNLFSTCSRLETADQAGKELGGGFIRFSPGSGILD
jgi:hypothetical protein